MTRGILCEYWQIKAIASELKTREALLPTIWRRCSRYPGHSSLVRGPMCRRTDILWLNALSGADSSFASSSDWPMSTIWRSLDDRVSRLDRSLISSSTSSDRLGFVDHKDHGLTFRGPLEEEVAQPVDEQDLIFPGGIESQFQKHIPE